MEHLGRGLEEGTNDGDDEEPAPEGVDDPEIEAEGDGFKDEDVDDELLLQAIENEMEIFDDDLVADFDEWFDEIPPDEIVLSTDEVPLVSSNDEAF